MTKSDLIESIRQYINDEGYNTYDGDVILTDGLLQILKDAESECAYGCSGFFVDYECNVH